MTLKVCRQVNGIMVLYVYKSHLKNCYAMRGAIVILLPMRGKRASVHIKASVVLLHLT